MIEKQCLQCGKSFFITPSRIKHGEGKYCTRGCADKAKKGKPSPNKGKKTGKPAWNRNKHPSSETLKKQSESHKGQDHWTGRHHSEEAKIKMGESHKRNPSKAGLGKHRSEETIRKIKETRSKKPRVHPKSEFKKGQTYEEHYGVKKAQQMKEKRRKYAIEHRDEYRDRMLRMYVAGKMPKTNTLPERLLKEELIRRGYEEKIDFIHQYRHGNYVFDFAFPKEKLIIEVQGTYWHADYRKYPNFDKLNGTQKRNLKRDSEKLSYALSMDGGIWHPLNLFEHEIKTNLKQEVDNIEDFLKRRRNMIN